MVSGSSSYRIRQGETHGTLGIQVDHTQAACRKQACGNPSLTCSLPSFILSFSSSQYLFYPSKLWAEQRGTDLGSPCSLSKGPALSTTF